jgi:hypothetical protein
MGLQMPPTEQMPERRPLLVFRAVFQAVFRLFFGWLIRRRAFFDNRKHGISFHRFTLANRKADHLTINGRWNIKRDFIGFQFNQIFIFANMIANGFCPAGNRGFCD